MKILRWDLLDSDESRALLDVVCAGKKGTALTIGGFDGPHRGHEALFNAVLENAERSCLAPGIVTFSRSPGVVTKGERYPGDVSTLNLRLTRFQSMGFAFVLLIDFSGDFGKMSGGVFFDILAKTVRMRYVAVGPDFRCGYRLDTGIEEVSILSRQKGFRFDSIRQVEHDGLRISSSSVRKAVQTADFALAERLLGHPFLLDFTDIGWIVSGKFLESPSSAFTQILPRRGRYSVALSTVRGKEVSAVVVIEDLSVRIEPATGMTLPVPAEIATARFWLS